MLIRVLLAGKDALSGPLRSVDKSAGGARQSLKAAKDEIKSLEQAQRDLANRRDLQQALADQRMKVAAQKRVVDELRDAYVAADRPTKQLTNNYEASHHKLARLNREEDKHLDRLRAIEARLEAAGHATGDYSQDQERLRSRISAANREIEDQERQLKQLAATERRHADARRRFASARDRAGSLATGGAAAMAGGAAVAYGLGSTVGEANSLQADMTTIGQRTDMSTAALARFEDRLLAISIAANQTREETTAIFENLSAQGYDPDKALQMGSAVARATTAYREDSGDVSNAAGSLRNIKIAADQTGQALDVMALAGKRGNFEFGDMARALPGLTSAAAAYKMEGLQGLADITAAAQIVRRGAGSSEEAATNLNNLFQKIGSPETAKKFSKVGINLRTELQRGEAAGKSALETIVELTKRATGGDASLLGNFFEDAQVQKALRPLMEATDEYRAIRAEALKANGVVDADFARRMGDNAEGAEAMKIAVQQARLEIGQQLAPVLSTAGRVVTRVSRGFTGWAKANPAWSKGLALGVLVVASLAVVIGALAIGAAAVLVPLAAVKLSLALLGPAGAKGGGGFLAAAKGAWAFTAALLANPVTWIVVGIIAAVALLAAAAYMIWKHWKPITAWFGRLWSGLQNMVGDAISAIASWVMRWTPLGAIVRNWGVIAGFFGDVWSLIKDTVALGVAAVWLVLLRFTPVGVIVRNWGSITGFVSRVWQDVRTATSTALAAVGSALLNHTPLGWIVRNWQPIVAFVGQVWSRLRAGVATGIAGIGSAILGWSPLKAFVQAFQAAFDWFAGLPERFRVIGGDIARGLAAGIRGARTLVANAAAAVTRGTEQASRKEADTHSPSRVFAAIGRDLMSGFALGITRNARLPTTGMRAAAAAVIAAGTVTGTADAALAGPSPSAALVGDAHARFQAGAVKAMALQSLPLPSTPGTAAPVPGRSATNSAAAAAQMPPPIGPIEIHIHAAPGMDERAVADLLMARLDQIRRAEAASARSSLDYEEG